MAVALLLRSETRLSLFPVRYDTAQPRLRLLKTLEPVLSRRCSKPIVTYLPTSAEVHVLRQHYLVIRSSRATEHDGTILQCTIQEHQNFTMHQDWQDIAFTNRHVHNRNRNRNRKGGQDSTSSEGNHTDVTKLFGTYHVSCPSAAKAASNDTAGNKNEGRLEIYCLNQRRNALLAELILPDVLHAGNVILAGSRKYLRQAISELESSRDETADQVMDENDDVDAPSVYGGGVQNEDDHNSDDEVDPDAFEENPAKQRQARSDHVFEKSSFRNCKFWVRYQGTLLTPESTQPSDHLPRDPVMEDAGYWIWPGSHTDRFEGTISCAQLGWDNVKISGRKTRSSSARDYQIAWAKE